MVYRGTIEDMSRPSFRSDRLAWLWLVAPSFSCWLGLLLVLLKNSISCRHMSAIWCSTLAWDSCICCILSCQSASPMTLDSNTKLLCALDVDRVTSRERVKSSVERDRSPYWYSDPSWNDLWWQKRKLVRGSLRPWVLVMKFCLFYFINIFSLYRDYMGLTRKGILNCGLNLRLELSLLQY